MESKEILRVDVWSAAKLFAAINLVLSVIIGILVTAAAMLGMAVGPELSGLEILGGGIIAAIVIILILAVLGMIFGFILGAIYAVIYNLAAGVFGGLKIELE